MSARWRVAFSLISVLSLEGIIFAQGAYFGFDRNDYPGDENLPELRKNFSYAGYWLNNPPGSSTNNWLGKRAEMERTGFGFLVLFNGRLYAELKTVDRAAKLGESDAQAAAASARREGFPASAIIFLDQEQGGRLLPEQKAYLFAWIDGVTRAGFRAGVYCSGIPAQDDGDVVTANDIRQNAGSRKLTYWVTQDGCPPSPGCTLASHPPSPPASGVEFADVWQFAQSPKRKDAARACHGYSPDGGCYLPGLSAAAKLHLDLNTATSTDPSHGQTHP